MFGQSKKGLKDIIKDIEETTSKQNRGSKTDEIEKLFHE